MFTTDTRQKSSVVSVIIIVIVGTFLAMRVQSIAAEKGNNLVEGLKWVFQNPSGTFDITKHNHYTPQIIFYSVVFGLVCALFMYVYASTYRRKVRLKSHGTARFCKPQETFKYREGNGKDPRGNTIFTKTEWFSRNMRKSDRNRNIVLVGRPGTGKSRYFFKPNLLNADGTIVATDPKGELLRDCGHSLLMKGYEIKVLNLDRKYASNNYNPLNYVKKIPVESLSPEKLQKIEDKVRAKYAELDIDDKDERERKLQELIHEEQNTQLAEDDVMSLIDCLFKNTKGDIDSTTGDPFWEKAEMIFLQSIIYYVLFRLPKSERNFESVLRLIRLATPKDEDATETELDGLFAEWQQEDPKNIGVKQYNHFRVARGKMVSTIIMQATSRLAPLNIEEVKDLTNSDNMELDRIGNPTPEMIAKMKIPEEEKKKLLKKHGKVAYFIITKPNDSAFNFIASLLYTQVFGITDLNAANNHGSLATPLDMYMDEWAQLGEIPRFIENLAYVRGLNVGITFALQSLDQLKKVYKDSWQSALDCCDYTMLLGSNAKETLEYFSTMLGETTVYAPGFTRNGGKNLSTSTNDSEVGVKLGTVDQIANMEKKKCLLLVANLGPFYSDMYDLTKHPDYSELYEPWKKDDPINNAKEYNHYKYVKKIKKLSKTQEILNEMGYDVDLIPASAAADHYVIAHGKK